MSGPILFGLLVSTTTMIIFVAIWRIGRKVDPVESRLEHLGLDPDGRALTGQHGSNRTWPGITHLLHRFGLGQKMALELARADIPMTAAEYTLLILAVALLGYLVGTVRLNLAAGLILAIIFAAVPILYLRSRKGRRQYQFTEQLPDILTLLVGGLRAGYGLSQSMRIVVNRMPPPASTEFARVVRAVELGLPLQQALREMSERVDADDVELVVTAINVQSEMGGNLAQRLETIAETVRDRIRLLREVRVLTSHQRFTGYVLAGLPVGIFAILMILRPEYMSGLFAPGWVRLLPIGAAILMFVGYLIMRRIMDIKV